MQIQIFISLTITDLHMERKFLFVSIILVLFLTIAIMPIKNYGFYVLLRWICSPCLYIIFNYYRSKNKYGLSVISILLALTYNPLLPLRLGRSIWIIINVSTIAIIIVANLTKKQKHTRVKKMGLTMVAVKISASKLKAIRKHHCFFSC